MPRVTITRESIIQVVEQQHPKSVSSVYAALGGRGNVSGSTAKKIRELVPDLAEQLNANKRASSGTTVAAAKKSAITKKSKGGKYRRAATNPFREGSGYGLVYDILAAHPSGLPRAKLVDLYGAASRKSKAKAGFDCAVVLSARDSVAGQRHRSCRDGFWIEKTADHVQLRTA